MDEQHQSRLAADDGQHWSLAMEQNALVPCAQITHLVLGMIDNNVYIIDDGAGCLVVDPSCDAPRILEALEGRKPDAIVITHGHWDHTGAAADLRKATGAKVIASAVETPYIDGRASFDGGAQEIDPCPVDQEVADGDKVVIGEMEWQIIATPGHTPGGICLFLAPTEKHPGAPILISGDTLFAGTHGRVDFPEGSIDDMKESLSRLSYLPENTVVLPGHNRVTTIANEIGWLRICRL